MNKFSEEEMDRLLYVLIKLGPEYTLSILESAWFDNPEWNMVVNLIKSDTDENEICDIFKRYWLSSLLD